jgi:hypothetical protein
LHQSFAAQDMHGSMYTAAYAHQQQQQQQQLQQQQQQQHQHQQQQQQRSQQNLQQQRQQKPAAASMQHRSSSNASSCVYDVTHAFEQMRVSKKRPVLSAEQLAARCADRAGNEQQHAAAKTHAASTAAPQKQQQRQRPTAANAITATSNSLASAKAAAAAAAAALVPLPDAGITEVLGLGTSDSTDASERGYLTLTEYESEVAAGTIPAYR